MTLAETLYGMMERSQKAAQPMDLRVGTVTSASPLEISINPQMPPLRRAQLYLTEAVVEKKLCARAGSEGTGGAALDSVSCIEHGSALPCSGGDITLNRALAAGDRVLLLRAEKGQQYVVLSRVFS